MITDTAPFTSVLADHYDALYGSRDVASEIDAMLRQVSGWLGPGPLDVLDIGCGTGQHIEALAARRHRVVGIDLSPDLVRLAQERNPDARVEVADMRSFALGRRFDLAVALFGVLDYLPSIGEVNDALRSTVLHLDRGRVLYAVVSRSGAADPQRQFREVENGDRRLLRWTTPESNDPETGVVRLRYDFLELDGDTVTRRHSETHRMRYYTATELRLFLETAGLRVKSLQVAGPTFQVLAQRA